MAAWHHVISAKQRQAVGSKIHQARLARSIRVGCINEMASASIVITPGRGIRAAWQQYLIHAGVRAANQPHACHHKSVHNRISTFDLAIALLLASAEPSSYQ